MTKRLLPIILIFILGACSLNENTTEVSHSEADALDTEIDGEKKYDVSSFEEFPLVSIIDGDTIKVRYHGADESVRFLLVDTPETNHPTLGEQPFGQEAKSFTKALFEGQDSVYLEFDVSYRDKYNRLLAYVYTQDGKSVQEELLKNGLARVAYIYNPNTKHVNWFDSVQKTAQSSAVGIWSVENYAQEDGFHPESLDFSSKPSNSNECLIKGNIGSDKIYHTPDSPSYEQTKAEVMFCTEEEAVQAGFRPPKQ